jgi:hypothetical protein
LDGDFRESSVEEVERNRIRFRADTRGTRDDTVKFLGIRSVQKFSLAKGNHISAQLDWNHQANGCYLSAALILSPEATSGNPLLGPEWLKVEYIGVPPGENARLHISWRVGGREQFLYTEGWPETNRQGRKISLQKIDIEVIPDGFRLLENGTVVYSSKEGPLPFEKGHLYLQMSSHSNYPSREIYFDEIRLPS